MEHMSLNDISYIQPSNTPSNEKKDFEFVHFVVAGERFKTQKKTLDVFPETLLGSKRRELHWDSQRVAYIFPDRCRRSFESILYFYQSSGILSQPENVFLESFVEEATFFEIPLNTLRVANSRSQWTYACTTQNASNHPSSNLRYSRLFGERTWTYKVIMGCDVFTTVSFVFCHVTSTINMDVRANDGSVVLDEKGNVERFQVIPVPFINWMELFCILWITVHYVSGIILSTPKLKYALSFMPMVDAIIVIAFVIDWVLKISGNNNPTTMPLRAICVLRLFNLARHSTLLYCLGLALRQSFSDLMHVLFVILFIIFLAAGFVYFIEGPECPLNVTLPCNYTGTKFTNVFISSYWAAVTITTVGYGDMVPVKPLGKVAGAIVALIGLPLIAIPMPLIMSKFDKLYKSVKEYQKITKASKTTVHISRPLRHCSKRGARIDVGVNDIKSTCVHNPDGLTTFSRANNGRLSTQYDKKVTKHHVKGSCGLKHAFSDTWVVAQHNKMVFPTLQKYISEFSLSTRINRRNNEKMAGKLLNISQEDSPNGNYVSTKDPSQLTWVENWEQVYGKALSTQCQNADCSCHTDVSTIEDANGFDDDND